MRTTLRLKFDSYSEYGFDGFRWFIRRTVAYSDICIQ
jgi:hypothetical protein